MILVVMLVGCWDECQMCNLQVPMTELVRSTLIIWLHCLLQMVFVVLLKSGCASLHWPHNSPCILMHLSVWISQ